MSAERTRILPVQFRLATMLIIFTVLIFAVAVCVSEFKPGEVTIRTQDGAVVVSHHDIVIVDWEKQSFSVRDGTKSKLSTALNGLSTPFKLYVGEDIIYAGHLTTSLSSRGLDGPVINCWPSTPNNNVTIQWRYPASAPPVGADIRFSRRLYNSLWFAGKIERNGG